MEGRCATIQLLLFFDRNYRAFSSFDDVSLPTPITRYVIRTRSCMHTYVVVRDQFKIPVVI